MGTTGPKAWEWCGEQDGPLNTNSISNILLSKLNLFLKCDGADQSTSSLPGFSDKLDFLEGDQKPVARSTKEGAKGQQMKKGYGCRVLFWWWCMQGHSSQCDLSAESVATATGRVMGPFSHISL